MNTELANKIKENPQYQQLLQKRRKLVTILSAIVLLMYFAMILAIAFDPAILGTPIGDSIITIGIPVGIGIIVMSFILTGIYIRQANKLDLLVEQIRKNIGG